MVRTLLAIGFGVVLGAGGISLASQAQQGQVKIKSLSEQNIVEKLDGKEAIASVVELTYEPGVTGRPHRHPGPVFGYVLEGEYELGLGDQAGKRLKVGETFYEPTGILHRVGRNPSDKAPTRVLAILLKPRDVKAQALPAGTKTKK